MQRRWRTAGLALLLAASSWANASDNPKAAQYYEDALKRYQRGDLPGARVQLKNALQIDKSMLQVQLLLGRVLLDSSEVAAAEVAFNEALRLGVDRAEVAPPLARALLDQSRPQEVIDHPRFALEGLPPEALQELLLLKAAAASDLGDHKKAVQFLEDARAASGARVETWLAETPLRIRAGQFAKALESATQALARLPDNAEAHYSLGSAHHAQAQLQPALKAYDQALRLMPTHQEALIARAGLHLDRGNIDLAALDLKTLKESRPREPRGAYLASQIALRRGDAAAARAALVEVTSLLDPVPQAMLRFKPQLLMLGGLAHHGLGQYGKAKPYLEAVQRLQGNVAASKLLAQIYIAEGNIDRAVTTLEDYLRAAPRDLTAVELLAQAHVRANRPARAVQVLRTALTFTESPQLRSSLGLALVGAGLVDEALPELESAWAKGPQEPRAGAALVNLYLQRKDVAKAQRLADALAKKQPTNPGFQDLLGTVRLRAGDLAGARKAYEEAARLDPKAIPPRLNLARMDGNAGRAQEAADRLAAVLKMDERSIEAMLELGLLTERLGRRDQAVTWYTKAADLSGVKDLRAALSLIALHLRAGEAPQALKATERLSPGTSEDITVLLATVRAHLANGDTGGARSLLVRATRIANFDVDTQVELSLLQLAAGNPAGAAYNLQKALSTDPGHLRANAIMVDVLLRQGDLDKAQQTAKTIASRHPKRAVGHMLEGDVAAARGQGPVALSMYKRAHLAEPSSNTLLKLHAIQARLEPAAARQAAERWIQANPKDLAVRHAHAGALARTGLLPEARKAFEALLALAPEDARALNDLANVLTKLRDPAALPTAERALKLAPSNANVIDTVAWAARAAGQPERALQLLRDARLRAPASAEIRYHLAQVLADAGRRNEARQELEPALRGGQWFESVGEARALMETLK
ncbi:MAG: PEP-CTERM system TPR-repeat protein PrsT [Rubrivivax sp.]|nr:PEP-CTERM system TPR-repeat protein PrsT [Rubrivivax sp.]